MQNFSEITCSVYLPCFRNNFLILDVYYQEITYTEVREIPEFEILSLMSEIGKIKSALKQNAVNRSKSG